MLNNTRKPEGLFGRLMVNGMNGGPHAALARWAMSLLPIEEGAQVLDIGCGGGANIARMLRRAAEGTVVGIDYSPVSVRKSIKVNADAIRGGCCRVVEGTVEALPFAEATFDLATAFETVYFWPDLGSCFSEVRRVLRPGGRFAIVNEIDGIDPSGDKWEHLISGMRIYKPDALRWSLGDAGFDHVSISQHGERHWLMAVATKA